MRTLLRRLSPTGAVVDIHIPAGQRCRIESVSIVLSAAPGFISVMARKQPGNIIVWSVTAPFCPISASRVDAAIGSSNTEVVISNTNQTSGASSYESVELVSCALPNVWLEGIGDVQIVVSPGLATVQSFDLWYALEGID